MELDQAAYDAHAFDYDESAVDQPLVELLQRFYTLSDNREHGAEWAKCFTDDAVMLKRDTDVTGREGRMFCSTMLSVSITKKLVEIASVNENSWNGQASRQHIVFKVFPFSPGKPDEIMLYGMSKYVFENGSRGEMPWAARLQLQRFPDGTILIKFYNIYPVSRSDREADTSLLMARRSHRSR